MLITKPLLHFQLKAVIKNRQNKIIFFLSVLLLFAFVGIYTVQDRKAVAAYPDAVQKQRELVSFDIHFLESRKQDNDGAEEEDVVLSMLLEDRRLLVFLVSHLKNLTEKPHLWQDILETKIAMQENVLQAILALEEGGQLGTSPLDLEFGMGLPYRYLFDYGTREDVEQGIWLNKKLLEENIHPLSSDYEMTSWQFLHKMMRILPALIPILMIIASRSVSASSQSFIHCHPIKRGHAVFCECGVIAGLSSACVLLLLAVGFLLAYFLTGTGELHYPLSQRLTVAGELSLYAVLMPIYAILWGAVIGFARLVYQAFS